MISTYFNDIALIRLRQLDKWSNITYDTGTQVECRYEPRFGKSFTIQGEEVPARGVLFVQNPPFEVSGEEMPEVLMNARISFPTEPNSDYMCIYLEKEEDLGGAITHLRLWLR